jgi:arylsulfatase
LENRGAARPNFLVILADDLGFADLGCYGSDIKTPNLDALAKNGLRFTQFYNTARCWPTRGGLLTGYYPQQINMDPPTGHLPPWTRFLPQWLKPLGYRSYHSGKWHVRGAENAVADTGFDHSYKLDDHNRNFSPTSLFEDDKHLPPVAKNSGYYTSTAFADHAIRCLKEHAAQHATQPFFSYLAFSVPHFPLHAPAEDVARYHDQYLKGWDVTREERWKKLCERAIVNCALSPLEQELTAPGFKPDLLTKVGPGEISHPVPWAQLTDEQKCFQATKMAIHAAMIDRMDQEIGRVLEQVRTMGAWDNTVILFLSDNGTSAELIVRGDGHDRAAAPGSAGSFLCLGPGWSSAGNAPFRRHKIWTHEGGISTPLIVHWPKGIAARGELRHDVGHIVDVVPTLLELAGCKPELPAGTPPFPGCSLGPALAKDGSVTRDYVFFNHSGNRALRMGDYKLVSAHLDGNDWALYNLATDRCEQHNLAAAQPDRVREMAARWQQLQDSFVHDAGPLPSGAQKRPNKKKAAKKFDTR